MVLIDSSILIGYLKGSENAPFKKLDELIENNIPFGICNLIYQEILQGAKTDKEFKLLTEYLSSLNFYEL